MIGMIVRSCIVVVLATACGQVEQGQVQAVQDESRVLGLVTNSDGTYEFKLCSKLDAYPDEVLADTNKCINPLVNADGSAKIFEAIPTAPSTGEDRLGNGVIALMVAVATGVLSAGVARYLLKTGVINRLAREKYVAGLESSFNATLTGLSKTEGNKMEARWVYEKLIMVQKGDGSFGIEPELRTHLLSGKKLNKFNKKIEDVEGRLADLNAELKSGEYYVTRIEQGIRAKIKQVEKAGEDSQAWKEKELIFADVREHLAENRLGEYLIENRSETIKKYLARQSDMTQLDQKDVSKFLNKLDDEVGKFLDAETIASGNNLMVLTFEELLAREKTIDKLVRKLKDLDPSTFKQQELTKKIEKIDELIEKYPVTTHNYQQAERLIKKLDSAKSVDRLLDSEYFDLADNIALNEGELRRIRKELRNRIKAKGSPTQVIDANKSRVRSIVNNTSDYKSHQRRITRDENELSDQGKTVWQRVKGVFKYRHEKVVVDEDEVIKGLANDQDVKIIDLKRGMDKFVGHLFGASAFVSTLALPSFNRKLPGSKRVAVANRWQALTAGGLTEPMTEVEDLRQLIDGLAEVSGAKVSGEVFYFLLRSGVEEMGIKQ